MRARLVLVALLAAALAGCGGTSTHTRVARYVTRVDAVERRLAPSLVVVSQANQTFARSQTSPGIDRRLQASLATMQRLRRRLAAIPTPAPARPLRARLLDLVDHEVALMREVEETERFAPRYQATLASLRTANANLQKTLAQTARGNAATRTLDAAKATELESYAHLLGRAEARVRALHPPPVWRPSYRTQLASLQQLQSASLALADAIRRKDAAAIAPLLRRFDAAAISGQSVAAQKRQIAAVKAYSRRIAALAKLAGRVQLERTRLQQRYP